MRLVYMGTPAFGAAVLRRIVAAGHQVLALFCQPDTPKGRDPTPMPPEAKVCAAEFSIPVLQPRRIGPKSTAAIAELAPDAIVVAAYGHILPPATLAIPRFGALNVHASLLPKYRGAAPIQWAVASGDKATGVSIMQMAKGLDTGDVIAFAEEPIRDDDTWLPLQDRLAQLGGELMADVLARLERGESLPHARQDDSLATWARPLRKDDARVEWASDCATLANRCRAFHPWPGTQTTFKGKQLKVFPLLKRATTDHFPAVPLDDAPGTILSVSQEGLLVACRDGALLLPEVQAEGKRRMSSFEFASGARIRPGDRLGS